MSDAKEMITEAKRKHAELAPEHEHLAYAWCFAHDLAVGYGAARAVLVALQLENETLRNRVQELEDMVKPKGPDHA